MRGRLATAPHHLDMDVVSALVGVVAIAFFVGIVVLTEVVRRPRPFTSGEEEAKGRSTGDESRNDL
jgi:hypothetical protein